MQRTSQSAALQISATTADLAARVTVEYHQPRVVARRQPYADENISLGVRLPVTMEGIYRVQKRVHEHMIELQEKYDVIIQASAAPEWWQGSGLG